MGLDNPIHIAFLLILLLLVFGAKRLPEMGRSLGDGMRGFKDALSSETTHTTSEPVAQPSLGARPQESTGSVVALQSAPESVREELPAA